VDAGLSLRTTDLGELDKPGPMVLWFSMVRPSQSNLVDI